MTFPIGTRVSFQGNQGTVIGHRPGGMHDIKMDNAGIERRSPDRLARVNGNSTRRLNTSLKHVKSMPENEGTMTKLGKMYDPNQEQFHAQTQAIYERLVAEKLGRKTFHSRGERADIAGLRSGRLVQADIRKLLSRAFGIATRQGQKYDFLHPGSNRPTDRGIAYSKARHADRAHLSENRHDYEVTLSLSRSGTIDYRVVPEKHFGKTYHVIYPGGKRFLRKSDAEGFLAQASLPWAANPGLMKAATYVGGKAIKAAPFVGTAMTVGELAYDATGAMGIPADEATAAFIAGPLGYKLYRKRKSKKNPRTKDDLGGMPRGFSDLPMSAIDSLETARLLGRQAGLIQKDLLRVQGQRQKHQDQRRTFQKQIDVVENEFNGLLAQTTASLYGPEYFGAKPESVKKTEAALMRAFIEEQMKVSNIKNPKDLFSMGQSWGKDVQGRRRAQRGAMTRVPRAGEVPEMLTLKGRRPFEGAYISVELEPPTSDPAGIGYYMIKWDMGAPQSKKLIAILKTNRNFERITDFERKAKFEVDEEGNWVKTWEGPGVLAYRTVRGLPLATAQQMVQDFVVSMTPTDDVTPQHGFDMSRVTDLKDHTRSIAFSTDMQHVSEAWSDAANRLANLAIQSEGKAESTKKVLNAAALRILSEIPDNEQGKVIALAEELKVAKLRRLDIEARKAARKAEKEEKKNPAFKTVLRLAKQTPKVVKAAPKVAAASKKIVVSASKLEKILVNLVRLQLAKKSLTLLSELDFKSITKHIDTEKLARDAENQTGIKFEAKEIRAMLPSLLNSIAWK